MKLAEPPAAGATESERAPGRPILSKRRIGKGLRVFSACAVYGALYGAMMALTIGMVMEFAPGPRSDDLVVEIWRLARPWHWHLVVLTYCTFLGGACGAFGGAAAGFAGNFIGARWGWWVAGGIGGLISPLSFGLI